MTSPAGMPRLWVDNATSGSSTNLLAASFAVAFIVHLILILNVSFTLPEVKSEERTTRALEVIVLRQAAPSEEKPEIADAFAQVDRVGGGIDERPDAEIDPGIEPIPEPIEPEPRPLELADEPLPSLLEPAQPPPPAAEETPTATVVPVPPEPELVDREAPPEPDILTQPEPDRLLAEPPSETARPMVTAAQILASRNLEIAELTSRIQHSSAAYASRPRRKAISASTREYKYASYLEAWRRKVERVGNLNYPDEAKRHKMYGNLILHVAVRADGSIERIRVLRSSGFDILDQAAVKIVELSAPFAPFPADIRAEADILDITRTWQFLRSNRLGWEN
jgi:protein TonB